MADEENTELDLDKVENPATEEEPSEEEDGEAVSADVPQKSKKKLMIIGGTVLLFLIILSVTGFLYIRSKKAKLAEQAKLEERLETVPLPEIHTAPLKNLDMFIVPIRDDNGDECFVRIGMSLELSEGTLVKEIEKNLSLIRSNVLNLILREKGSIFRTAKGRKQVREKIRNIINVTLQTGTIKKIYFTELVIL